MRIFFRSSRDSFPPFLINCFRTAGPTLLLGWQQCDGTALKLVYRTFLLRICIGVSAILTLADTFKIVCNQIPESFLCNFPQLFPAKSSYTASYHPRYLFSDNVQHFQPSTAIKQTKRQWIHFKVNNRWDLWIAISIHVLLLRPRLGFLAKS
jgi:hypothetical protein